MGAYAGCNGGGHAVLVHPRVLLGSDIVPKGVLARGEERVDEGTVIRRHRLGRTGTFGSLAFVERSSVSHESSGESSEGENELHDWLG